jgi:hypothetical protein
MTVELASGATVLVDARLLSNNAITDGGNDGNSSPPMTTPGSLLTIFT